MYTTCTLDLDTRSSTLSAIVRWEREVWRRYSCRRRIADFPTYCTLVTSYYSLLPTPYLRITYYWLLVLVTTDY